MVCYLTGQDKHKFNESKLQILLAVDLLASKKMVANSVRIRKLTGLGASNVGTRIRQMISYLEPEFDKKRTDGCNIKYKMTKQGRRVLGQLIDRYERGETLNLRKTPVNADYSEFVLLPGLQE